MQLKLSTCREVSYRLPVPCQDIVTLPGAEPHFQVAILKDQPAAHSLMSQHSNASSSYKLNLIQNVKHCCPNI